MDLAFTLCGLMVFFCTLPLLTSMWQVVRTIRKDLNEMLDFGGRLCFYCALGLVHIANLSGIVAILIGTGVINA